MSTSISLESFFNTCRESSVKLVALETAETFHNGLATSILKDTIPGLIAGFKQLIGIDNADKSQVKNISSDQRSFLRLLEQQRFTELRYIKGFTPEGFVGKYIPLLQLLNEQINYCATLEDRALNEYVTMLAVFSSGGAAIKSLDAKELKNKELQKQRDELEKKYSEQFISSNSTRTTLDKLVDNNSDWETVFDLANTAYENVSKINRKQIEAQCTKAATYLEIIAKKIEQKQLEGATPEACRAIAEGAEQMGFEMEYISKVYYRTLVAFNSIDKTVAEIRRVVKA